MDNLSKFIPAKKPLISETVLFQFNCLLSRRVRSIFEQGKSLTENSLTF